MTKDKLAESFRNRFHKEATDFFFCPGRVNLIGEHIDYNGGKVLPAAISLGTYLAIAENNDGKLRFECENFPETGELPLQAGYTRSGNAWYNYPVSVIDQIVKQGHVISGLDMFYYGNLPIGAGLSSSASIEVLTLFTLNELFNLGLTGKTMALMGKKAENEFIGVNSGIMDQFAVAMGKKDHAILLDCDTLEYSQIPFQTGDYILAIINSNKQRTLADSKYNERFGECREALRLLNGEISINHLCDISSSTLQQHIHLLQDPVLVKRARHVVSENERVGQAVQAMTKNDLVEFGRLLYASHFSLQHDYEVSGKELDTIVAFCESYDGCIGARMTGAGFGGCAIALVREDRFDDFADKLSDSYLQTIGYAPEIFAARIDDGVHRM